MIVSTDPISDMLTRIRNASMANKNRVSLPYSKTKEEIAKILVRSGYLKSAKSAVEEGRKYLQIEISDENRPSVITEINRLSSPGRRIYVESKTIPKVKHGRGIVVISTSKGMMTGAEAAAKNIGGELICEVY